MKYLALILIVLLFGCSSPQKETEHENTLSNNENGIGKYQNMNLPPINDSLMLTGKNLFEEKCSECHTMEFKNSGPDISDLLSDREPEWLMNFLTNKNEMLERDSIAQITLSKFDENCGSEISSDEDARKLLEYLRQYQIWLHEFNVK